MPDQILINKSEIERLRQRARLIRLVPMLIVLLALAGFIYAIPFLLDYSAESAKAHEWLSNFTRDYQCVPRVPQCVAFCPQQPECYFNGVWRKNCSFLISPNVSEFLGGFE